MAQNSRAQISMGSRSILRLEASYNIGEKTVCSKLLEVGLDQGLLVLDNSKP